MNPRHIVGIAAPVGKPVQGSRVHVSDASPQGFRGHVTAVPADSVIVTRDSGVRELITLSRRRVTVLSQ